MRAAQPYGCGRLCMLSVIIRENRSAQYLTTRGPGICRGRSGKHIERPEAAINFYRLGKRISYNQTSNGPPTTVVSMDGGVDSSSSDPFDLFSARVLSTSPTLLSPASPFSLTQFLPGYWGSSRFYPSLAEMDTDLPPGDTFGYLIEGGSLGNRLRCSRFQRPTYSRQTYPFYRDHDRGYTGTAAHK